MTAELENDDAAFVEIEGIGSSDKDDGDFKNDTTKQWTVKESSLSALTIHFS